MVDALNLRPGVENKTRFVWVDQFRGVLILLMVAGHAGSPFNTWIYTFHVAAFFILSGFTHSKDRKRALDTIKRRVVTLIIPYYLINIGFFVVYSLVYRFGYHQFIFGEILPIGFLVRVNTFFRWPQATTGLGGPLWFLLVLFYAEVAYCLLQIVADKLKAPAGFEIINGFALGLVLSCLLNQPLLGRFAFDLGFYALIYFSLGATWRRLYDKGLRANMNLLLPLVIMLFIFFSKPFSRQGAAMNWPTRRFVPLPAEILMVFSPIAIIFFILKNLESIQPLGKILGMIGRHTFSILAYHFLIFKIISIVLFKCGVIAHTVVKGDVPIGLSGNLWILYSGLSVLICLLISKVASRCLPINYLVNGSFETKNE